MRDKERRR